MSFKTVKGYLMVVFSGAILLAVALLVILQWGNASDFSLYGKNYSPILVDGKKQGGVNTGFLMLMSAAGGVICLLLARMLIRGALLLRSQRTGCQESTAPPTETADPTKRA